VDGRQYLAAFAVSASALLFATAFVPSVPPTSADFGDPTIVAAAHAGSPAVRGRQLQLTPPPPQRCNRVAVVGDSLTAASRSWLDRDLDAAGIEHIIDGQVSRRIPATVRDPYSGVSATRRIRSSWGEADCGVIGLGSNDLEAGADDPISAARWIGEELAAVTPGARVWWINVSYRHEPGNPFDFASATTVFNAALDTRASTDALVEVIDWHGEVVAHPTWLVDGVHVRSDGYRARTQLTVAALTD